MLQRKQAAESLQMQRPRFSIVVPTLNRADTLRHTLETLRAQTFEDCEIIVQNNGAEPRTEALVRGLDPRLRHFSTQTVVPMTENWERALDHVTGEYVTYVGDDDGLFPDACQIASNLLGTNGIDLLSWSPHWYFWPAYEHASFKNRLIADVDYIFRGDVISSRSELRRVYAFETGYSRLPMIYNSFVPRVHIERLRKNYGSYFFSHAPDVISGIANAATLASFVRLSRPLSMTGTSHHSVGHGMYYSNDRARAAKLVERDFSTASESAPPCLEFQLFLANEMLAAKRRLFPNDTVLSVSYRGLMQALASSINDHPIPYESTLASIRSVGEAHGIDAGEIFVPERAERASPPGGATLLGPAHVSFVLDGSTLGLETIADAVRLSHQLLPRPSSLDFHLQEQKHTGIPILRTDLPLIFARGASGTRALVQGWSEPEPWGTWSDAKRCQMTFQIEYPKTEREVEAELLCDACVHKLQPNLEVDCEVGNWSARWTFSVRESTPTRRLVIPRDAVNANGEVDIYFNIPRARSPAGFGIGSDTRLLGIGVKEIRLRD